MELRVTCERCNCTLEHVCKPEFRRAAVDLYKTVLEGDFKELLEHSDHYDEDAEHMPFFSETFLYALLGKDAARTVLSHVSSLIREAGLDPHELEQQAWLELVQSKVQLSYDREGDVLVLRKPGRVKDTKERKGLTLLYGEPKVVLGLSIPKASAFDEEAVPNVLWLKDAFALWKHGSWPASDIRAVR